MFLLYKGKAVYPSLRKIKNSFSPYGSFLFKFELNLTFVVVKTCHNSVNQCPWSWSNCCFSPDSERRPQLVAHCQSGPDVPIQEEATTWRKRDCGSRLFSSDHNFFCFPHPPFLFSYILIKHLSPQEIKTAKVLKVM